MKFASLLFFCFCYQLVSAQMNGSNPIGIFDGHKDIGNPKLAGILTV